MRSVNRRHSVFIFTFFLLAMFAEAEVMLQWFETDWDEMYRRLPEAAQIGYDFLWVPPPTKGPTGTGTKWANVGYNLYDRFDIGDIPQRGSIATRYGTRGSLRNMVDSAHRLDIKIIPDIVMNHNGNGPDFRDYPGMKPEDFHLQWQNPYVNQLTYLRGPRMDQWSPWGPGGEGTGGTLWMELAQLIDIRTEPDNRFTGGANTPGWNLVAGASYLRHRGQYDKYPYYTSDPSTYSNETAQAVINRWITWLGNAVDYDGLRIDAAKHTPWEFFGTRGQGFLHEAQYNYNQRRGYADSSANEADMLFQNYVIRDDALLFAEILSPWSEIEYWYGTGSNTRNPMRFLDYAMKQSAGNSFNGNLAGLGAYGTDFGPANGILYVWGHDEGGPSKINLAYAYILTHVGLPMVYFTGNNIQWSDYGRAPWPTAKTWMIPGYDDQALGDRGSDIRELVWINQQFARGAEKKRWEGDGDFFALERYDDKNSSGTPDAGEGLLLVALNDSGYDITKNNVTVAFTNGTWLHDYTGNNPSDIQVYNNAGTMQVNVTVPGNGGQGWVCYAPRIPEDVNAEIWQGASLAPTMTWVVPGGTHASDKTQQITRVTSTNLRVNVNFRPQTGEPVDSVMIKWGDGRTKLTATNYWGNSDTSIVGGFFEKANQGNTTNWYMDVQLTGTNISEGLNVIKARVFVARTNTMPALFNTATKVVYVDRRGPELDIWPANSATITGDCVMLISNRDFTAYGMTVAVDGTTNTAHEIMKGLWKYNLTGLSAGPHSIVVTATEADWATSRAIINTSIYSRSYTVAANPNTITINHPDGTNQQLHFFYTTVQAPGAPSSVRLYWDNYELPWNAGNYTNVFNGEILLRDGTGVDTGHLWGAFANGQHFFQAVRVDGGVTSRAVKRVTFNLYGVNAIDTDGDSLPDTVEMPYFDQGAPGPDQPWPGDDNDFVPEAGENWTRLNVYHHSTFFSGTWDDNLDSDGDGYKNGDEVKAGYYEGNIYKYNIYDASSKPTTNGYSSNVVSTASWTPSNAVKNASLTVTYRPNDGTLKNATQVWMHVGHSLKTLGAWTNVIETNATALGGGQWQVSYLVPTNATSVDFTFWDGAGTWDGKDWQAVIQGSTTTAFNIDGTRDSTNFLVWGSGMHIWAAVRGTKLYVSTWGTNLNDNFIYVTDQIGDAKVTPWGKAGMVFFDTANKPYAGREGDNLWAGWFNVSGQATSSVPNDVFEGEFDMVNAFRSIPEAVYICAVSYETGSDTNGEILAQGPDVWDTGNTLDAMEFLRVPIASIRDDDYDGVFDVGKPQMWTVVDEDTRDANYGLRRFFLNELAGDTRKITVILQPNCGTNQVTNVELFSNLNRRDFAALPGDEDWSLITPTTIDKYYRAYPMTNIGGGQFSYTVVLNKCGAYRINARYRVNGGSYVYYTDNGLRRDCAVVVSPKKALDLTMYELNPMIAEASDDTFFGRSTFQDMYAVNTDRPDRISTNKLKTLGVNMVWLQPIHPIGGDNRQTDPATGQAYDPGSPYAVRNYWKVNSVLGDPSTDDQAMNEFTNFVQAFDANGIGVMLDGTFNHSAWDCEAGQVAVDMFPWATDPSALIRNIRPQWYSKYNSYGEYASYYFSANNTDIAPAPDRMDFGKWNDAADFYFGRYDCLVQGAPIDTNWAWSSGWYNRYLSEEDRFVGFETNATRELWQYFAQYPIYWLEKTGHPVGTPKNESYKGIDGLRCDFAQGLPSLFWEYTINKTRSVKWDFLFMAESLDGYRTVGGSSRHGVGYRSSRHFDILNENMVFYWRDKFFDYLGYNGNNPTPQTYPTWKAFDDRRNAFDVSPILLNITSHDEIYPNNSQWRLVYAYAIQSGMDGAHLLLYGQEAGAQNDANNYAGTDVKHNFARYETNFSKSIPSFKRYNHMTNVWHNGDLWMTSLRDTYGRINWARQHSPALRSQNNYMLSGIDGWNPDIFVVAKYEAAGMDVASQDVVFVAVNNNFEESTNRYDRYNLNVESSPGVNWFGIKDSRTYNVVDLMSPTPTNWLWSPSKPGTEVKTNFWVGLNGNPYSGQQAQYLKLVDTAVTYPDYSTYKSWDKDNDGLPDDWELANGLDPNSATGTNGPAGDRDGDGIPNADELLAGTAANNANDYLALSISMIGDSAGLTWPSKLDVNYDVESADRLAPGPVSWQSLFFGTAFSNEQTVVETVPTVVTSRFYRVKVKP